MAVPPRPHAGDIVISGTNMGAFVLSDSAGAGQIACATIKDLLDCAARYSHARHAGFWCEHDDHTYTSVADPALLSRMWSEFLEMPGLRLTRAQAQLLWGVTTDTCLSALETLVALNALVCTADGKYARPSTVRPARQLQHAS
jgi:hypothetical protein